jgi:hypothetical protein
MPRCFSVALAIAPWPVQIVAMTDALPTPPKLAGIIAALQRLDGDAGAAVIEHHADLIHIAMLNVIAADRARGHEIGSEASGFYARPKVNTAGPARELTDLAAKCRKAIAGKISRENWTTVWAAQPDRIKALWKPTLIETAEGRTVDSNELGLGFEMDDFAILAPKPEIVRPAIEAALAKITATPEPKTRKRNAAEVEAIKAIRAAYLAITGTDGGRVIREGKLTGRLVWLGREIDRIFQTKLFAETDSRRLR